MSVHYAESVDKVADNLAEVRPTIFIGVPRIFRKGYAKAKLKSYEREGLNERIFDWRSSLQRSMRLKIERDEPIVVPGSK
jgi:long-chain acyl-CoA synthetase